MRTKKFILCFVAMATLFLFGCQKEDIGGNGGNSGNGGNGGSTDNSLANTTWVLNSPDDETYHGDVIYTVSFGASDDVKFTRNIDYGTSQTDIVMLGTYTYSDGSGVAEIHNEGETTDYRITFSVEGNTLIWNFSLREIRLQKQ